MPSETTTCFLFLLCIISYHSSLHSGLRFALSVHVWHAAPNSASAWNTPCTYMSIASHSLSQAFPRSQILSEASFAHLGYSSSILNNLLVYYIYIFLWSTLLEYKLYEVRDIWILCSLIHPWHVLQCLAYSRSSIKIC